MPRRQISGYRRPSARSTRSADNSSTVVKRHRAKERQSFRYKNLSSTKPLDAKSRCNSFRVFIRYTVGNVSFGELCHKTFLTALLTAIDVTAAINAAVDHLLTV